MVGDKASKDPKPNAYAYDLYGKLVSLKNVPFNQLKPIFGLSNVNVKRTGRIDPSQSNPLKEFIEKASPSPNLVQVTTKLGLGSEIEKGYVQPEGITNLFDRVKLSEGVRVIENGCIKQDKQHDSSMNGNSTSRITKTNYNKL